MSISFADRNGVTGYQVRVTRNKKQYSKFFSSKIKGAKKLAKEYENELIKKLGPPVFNQIKQFPVRTNTGFRYISETINTNGKPSFRILIRNSEGRWKATDVSIEKYGKEKALKKAKQIVKERHHQAKR